MKNTIPKRVCTLICLFSFLLSALDAEAQLNAEGVVCPLGSTLDTEAVVNGDFSAGNTGFTSAYPYVSGAGSLWTEGVYAISHNPHDEHPLAPTFYDHTTGTPSGYLMAINGASSVANVWCQTITVAPGSNYQFSAWFRNWSTDTVSNLPVIQYEINGTLIGVSTFTFAGTLATWSQFNYTWYSGSNTSATICINDQQTAAIGNDFAIDDISFRRCIPPAKLATVPGLESVSVYPNPGDGHFSVGNVPANASIAIYNTIGTKIFSASDINSHAVNDIDLSRYPDGVYFLELRTEENPQHMVQQIVVRH